MGHFITSKDIPADGEHIKEGSLSKWIGMSGGIALLGFIVSGWLLFSNNPAENAAKDSLAGRYAYSWLFAFAFFVSFALGAAFWLLLHHVSNSGWGISVRRLMEHLACVFPWMALIAVPFFFPQVQQHLFEWMNIHRGFDGVGAYGSAKDALHHSSDPHHHLLYLKYFYTSLPFWLGRMIGYFVILGACLLYLRKLSVAQDNDPNPGVARLKKARRRVSWMLPIFAITVTFLAFDLLKALDYKWFSTMYGVYFFAGCALNGMALLILTTIVLRQKGYLQTVMSPEHHHIMGKLTFAFVVFWAYVSFSQFFLIWYANITEETGYFILRNTGNWNIASTLLVFCHFALPFLFLIRQDVKKNPKLMIPITIYLFVLHALDHYIIVAPERGPSLTHGASLFPSGSVVWLDLLAFLTVGAFFACVFLRSLTKCSLYPHRDPRILESANLHN